MAEAAAIGIPAREFWFLTPVELRAQFLGAKKRMQRENQLAMFNAWHAGAFSRWDPRKRLPNLQGLLNKLGERREMNNRELRTAIMGVHKAMGGSVRVVPKGSIRGSR